MSDRRTTARAYFAAFEADDHEAILGLLTDDVVWDIPSHRHLVGRVDFAAEITNPAFRGSPRLSVDRVVDAGDTVVVPHVGETRTADGALFRFAACDILTFAGDLICRVESYVVPTDPPA